MSVKSHKAILAILGDDFIAKAVKLNFGHDRNGAMCNVYYKGKKAFEFHDDGWGGEVEIKFTSKTIEQTLTEFCGQHNISQVMFANEWNFYDNHSEISQHTQFAEIAEALIYKNTLNKELKRIMRLTKGKLVYGNDQQYQQIGWKGISDLSELLQYKNGLDLLQENYNQIKKELAEGDRIFNTEEQLKALGITL